MSAISSSTDIRAADGPVLILGAGINGAALARELLLNGIPVHLVDTADICYGATAYSSRLIHGGLRYLEYGEFDLVRESLRERGRLLRLAPQFVRPLRLFVPVQNRLGGIGQGVSRFLGDFTRFAGQSSSRGLWLIGIGLWFYETYARDRSLPRRSIHRPSDAGVPPVDPTRYRWLYSYYDAQIVFPERFVLALLEDARRLSVEKGVPFHIHTYHRATLEGRAAHIVPVGSSGKSVPPKPLAFEPAAVVNATGAWVDRTLQSLRVSGPPLMGGTKGSHLITFAARLRERLGGSAVYTEAADGRPVFILPFGAGVLVGTTDLPFDQPPEEAVAEEDELDYLVEAANSVFPALNLTRAEIGLHYSGVRPLPAANGDRPAAVTRRHWLEPHPDCEVPLYSVIGGKLTTCRSLAESAAQTLLERLGREPIANSQERPLPGGEDYPEDDRAVALDQLRLAAALKLGVDQIQEVWRLCGTRAESILTSAIAPDVATDRTSVSGTALPRGFVRWVIGQEWVTHLGDLIERRLLLLYQPGLSRRCLYELAGLLVEEGRLPEEAVEAEVAGCIARLREHFGKELGE